MDDILVPEEPVMSTAEFEALKRNDIVKVGLASRFKGSVGLVRGKNEPDRLEYKGYVRIFTTDCKELHIHHRHVRLHQIEKEI